MEVHKSPFQIGYPSLYDSKLIYDGLIANNLIQCTSKEWDLLFTYDDNYSSVGVDFKPIIWYGSEKQIAYLFHITHYSVTYLYKWVALRFEHFTGKKYERKQLTISAQNIGDKSRSIIIDILRKSKKRW